jgi:hypothetical protein
MLDQFGRQPIWERASAGPWIRFNTKSAEVATLPDLSCLAIDNDNDLLIVSKLRGSRIFALGFLRYMRPKQSSIINANPSIAALAFARFRHRQFCLFASGSQATQSDYA